MKLEAAVIQGDGVGPEMMEEAVRVLQAVCRRFGHHLKLYPVLACSQAIEAGKEPLPQESLKICTQVPAVLFGNSGLKKYQDWPLDKRPEGALMILRKVLQVSTNIRPVRMYPSLKCFSPLKAERLEQGMDVAFVRDIAGGVFCSAKVQGNGDGGREAYEYEYYNETIVRKLPIWTSQMFLAVPVSGVRLYSRFPRIFQMWNWNIYILIMQPWN